MNPLLLTSIVQSSKNYNELSNVAYINFIEFYLKLGVKVNIYLVKYED